MSPTCGQSLHIAPPPSACQQAAAWADGGLLAGVSWPPAQRVDTQCVAKGRLSPSKTWPFRRQKVAFWTLKDGKRATHPCHRYAPSRPSRSEEALKALSGRPCLPRQAYLPCSSNSTQSAPHPDPPVRRGLDCLFTIGRIRAYRQPPTARRPPSIRLLLRHCLSDILPLRVP